MSEKETYSMRAKCCNCKESWKVAIPKGMPTEAYERSIKCTNCECSNIIIVPLKEW